MLSRELQRFLLNEDLEKVIQLQAYIEKLNLQEKQID
tara:strand:+ start:92 stop:202 length:111 start_codon:yes stop_codon:yes gene_type:complete